jgi:hypothetical protein
MNESMNEGMDGKKNGLLGSWRDDLIKWTDEELDYIGVF